MSPSSVPGLAFPASLTMLELDSRVEAGIVSAVPVGLSNLTLSPVCAVESPAKGSGTFLSGLARLHHLTKLHLHRSLDPDWPAAGPAYPALAASSSMVELTLYFNTVGVLPAGVWQYVFPAGRKLPHLRDLNIYTHQG